MSESNRSDGTVGYKRPPVDRQFKDGQSGNPKGRPKGRKNLKTIFVEALNKKVKLRDKNGTRTVPKLEAMIEVNINKALAGDTNAFARIIQIADKLEVFTWQPEERIDLTGYNLIMKKLEALGYGKTRPKLAPAGNETIELQQPASNDDPILPRSTNQKPDGIFGSDK
jgi:Family of unknown function (DUF5681)